MIWIKDLEDKYLKNEVLKAPGKLAILRYLVDFEAQTILSTGENDYKNVYTNPEDTDLLTNYRVRAEILPKYTTDDQLRVYFGDGGAAMVKTLRIEHIIQETINLWKREWIYFDSLVQLPKISNDPYVICLLWYSKYR